MKESNINSENSKRQQQLFMGITMGCLLLLFVYFIWAAVRKELWYDEVAIIGFIRSELSLHDVLQYYLTIEVTNLPLYAMIVYGFYHLLPAENIWILMPGMLMTLAGVLMLVRMTDRLIGRKAAYAVLCLCLFSTTIVNRLALELRAYALLFLAAVFTTDYVLHLKEDQSMKNLVIASFAAVILAYSHYFGVFYLAILGLITLINAIHWKREWKMLLPFVIAAILFLPWFVAAMRHRMVDTGSFWIAPPGILELPETVGYLLGGNALLCLFYGVGFVCLFYDILFQRKIDFWRMVFLISGPAVMILIFIYSRWINPNGGLYENRYFIVILPCVLVTSAYGLDRITTLGEKKYCKIISSVGTMVFIAACILGGRRSYMDSVGQYDRYSYSADRIIEENDIDHGDVLLLCVSYDDVGEAVLEGWYDYYLAKKGYAAQNRLMVSESSLDKVLSSEYITNRQEGYRKIYVMGDTDHITYRGTTYQITEQEPFCHFTVLEKQGD